jgi:hypothetical protein
MINPENKYFCLKLVGLVTMLFLLKCLYQARKVNGHVCVFRGIDFASFSSIFFN